MAKPLLVLTTYPDHEQAVEAATALVEARLAACVNVLAQMTSVYEWQGTIQRGSEHLLLIKTTAARYPALEAALRERHPYELPEIIAVPITQGWQQYLAWIEGQTTPGTG
jgi:periplasmic divalent cation tolerance protein